MRIDINGKTLTREEIIYYPDGQTDVVLTQDRFWTGGYTVIDASIQDFMDLEVLLSTISSLRRGGAHINSLRLKYLFGMRSDRKFQRGGSFYFHDVVAPIINGLNIPRVILLCPHNETVAFYINNSVIDGVTAIEEVVDFKEGNLIVFPDKSAHNHFPRLGYLGHGMVSLDKQRIGKTVQSITTLDNTDNLKILSANTIYVMDDLCDGGATFIEAARYIREVNLKAKLILVIVHGLFTKGIQELLIHYDEIITTDSCGRNFEDPRLKYIQVFSGE